jgi:hypothetical protein
VHPRARVATADGHLVAEAQGIKDSHSLSEGDADDPLVDADISDFAAEFDVVNLSRK